MKRALAVALCLASVATACGGGDDESSGTAGATDAFAAYRTLCLDTINQLRATRGLGPQKRWTDAEACVDGSAKTDGSSGKAHAAFSGGTTCGANAQNECPGWGTDYAKGLPACLQAMWAEKDRPACKGCDTCDFPYQGCTDCTFFGTNGSDGCGHYLNMKSQVLTKVACGFWDGGWYTQNFAP